MRGGWRRQFTLALTREEIEEDLFLITGTGPARRLRKRPRNIQKQLDVIKTHPLSCVFISLYSYWCWIEGCLCVFSRVFQACGCRT